MRWLAYLSFLVLSASPAAAGVMILVDGPNRDCYLQTLTTSTPQHNREALDVCDKTLMLNMPGRYNRAASFVNRSDIRLRMQDWRGVVSDTDRALKLEPELAPAHLNRGAGLIGLKRYDEALEPLEKAITLGVDTQHLAYFNRGLAKEAMGDIKGAYYDFRKAAELEPRFELANEQLARFKVVRSP